MDFEGTVIRKSLHSAARRCGRLLLVLVLLAAAIPMPRAAAQDWENYYHTFAGQLLGGWSSSEGTDYEVRETSYTHSMTIVDLYAEIGVTPTDVYTYSSWGDPGSSTRTGIYIDFESYFGSPVDLNSFSLRCYQDAPGIGTSYWIDFLDSEQSIIDGYSASMAGASGWFTLDASVGVSFPLEDVYAIAFHVGNAWGNHVDWIQFQYDVLAPPDEEPDEPEYYYRPLVPDDEQGTSTATQFASNFISTVIDSNTYQPYMGDDDGSNAPLDDMNKYVLMYRSIEPGAPVHSPGYGIVESIADVTGSDCNNLHNLSTPAGTLEEMILAAVGMEWLDLYNMLMPGSGQDYCYVDGADGWISGDMQSAMRYVNNGFGSWDGGLTRFSEEDALLALGQVVTIHHLPTDIYISYWVMDADQFVVEGQVVLDGCVIGRTMPAFMVEDASADIVERTIPGIGFIWGEVKSGESFYPQDLHLMFWFIPDGNDPCSNPDFGACVNLNSGLDYPLYPWVVASGVSIPDFMLENGYRLLGDQSTDLIQTIVLPDPNDEYAIKLQAQVLVVNDTDTDSVVDLIIGDDSYEVTIPKSGVSYDYVSVLDVRDDSDYATPGMIDIEVQYDEADDSGVVLVTFVCVDNQADPITPPPTCMLANYGFDDDVNSEWSLTGTAVIEDGGLELSSGDAAYQSLDLTADTYQIVIRARALPQSPPPGGGYDAALDYRFEDSESSLVCSGEVTPDDDDWQEFSALECEVTDAVTGGTFELNADYTTDPVQVDYVCLIPSWTTAENRECQACPAQYVGDAIADNIEAIEWHACRIRQLYYCDWRELVEDTRDATVETVRGLGMLGRWLSETIQRSATFVTSVARYLGGHLNNVGLAVAEAVAWNRGGSTTIVQGTQIGFWDVLGLLITGLRDVIEGALHSLVELVSMLLGFLTPIAGALLEIVELIVSSLFSLVNQLIDQVELIYYFIMAIIDALNNADPVTIPGAPDCSTLEGGNWICWGFYILDNTIFSGPAAGLLPLLIGACALNLLLWGFTRVKVALINAG